MLDISMTRRPNRVATLLLSGTVGLLGACGHDKHGEGHGAFSPLDVNVPAVGGGGQEKPSPTDREPVAANGGRQPVDAPGGPRPDIVLVVADDMRWDLMSGEGHPFLDTPNLDRFAGEAAKMNKAFVPVAVCSPSRASILTGREPHRASTPNIVWRNNSFLQTQRTFAQDLQDAGYLTAYVGKWHLGDGAIPKRGFDHWESFDWLGDFFDPTVHINGVEHRFEGYVDDVLSARADHFLQTHADSDKPIFLMVGLKAPHLQFDHPKRHDHAFDSVDIPTPDTYDEDFSISGKLQAAKDWIGVVSGRGGIKHFDHSWDKYIKKHYRAILGLDDSIGTLRAATRHRDKEDNTLFIYTSDNGYSLGDHGMTEKHMVYEEPIRVPFLIDFPGEADQGFRFDGLVSTLDIAPTALDYAAVPIPERMDGRSLRPLVEPDRPKVDGSPERWRDELFLSYEDWQVAVRTDRYKYIESLQAPGHVELYDLERDPKETRSVHADADYATILAKMDARLDRAIERNQWSIRKRYALQRVLVSSPVPDSRADAAARAISLAEPPVAGERGAAGLDWSLAERDTDGFVLGADVPVDSAVLVAIPLERRTSFDPFVRLDIGGYVPKGMRASMYVDGEPYWDNFERRPIDFPNPPMREASALVVVRLDGSGTIGASFGVKSPEDVIRLPLESRVLGENPERFAEAE